MIIIKIFFFFLGGCRKGELDKGVYDNWVSDCLELKYSLSITLAFLSLSSLFLAIHAKTIMFVTKVPGACKYRALKW